MKILSGAELAKIKSRILQLLGTALEEVILPEGAGAEAEQERLSGLHAYLKQIKPELIASLDRITPFFLEEYGDDWVIEKFKSTLDVLINESHIVKSGNSKTYTDCLKKLKELIEAFS